jgi:hypothetical protein
MDRRGAVGRRFDRFAQENGSIRSVQLGGRRCICSDETDATIAFSGALADLPTWRQPLVALVLYRDSDSSEWVVVATTVSCGTWDRHGQPKPPYWEFRLDPAGWREVPLSPASIGRPANLFQQYHGKNFKSTHVAAADLARLQPANTMARAYREVWGDPDQFVCGEGDSNKR